MGYYSIPSFEGVAQIAGPPPPRTGYAALQRILELADCEPLFEQLRQYNHTGRPPYPVDAMWRVFVLKYLRGIRYNTDLIRALHSEPRLRDMCGLGDRVPSASMLSRFFQHLTRHEDLVRQARLEMASEIARLVDYRSKPDARAAGSIIAIDSTDVPSFANGNREPRTDLDAEWGHKSSHKTKDGTQIEWVFGYKIHLICCAVYGIPLSYVIMPANAADTTELPDLVEKTLWEHPWLEPGYLVADKGYDSLSNHQHLDDLGIDPIILIRGAYRHGDLYDTNGQPICVGNVPMEYVRTDDAGQHHFRCPPEGCHLKNQFALYVHCRDTCEELPEGDLLRTLGRTSRASQSFQDVYNRRQTIERFFGSAKRSRLLDQHQYRGLRKIRLHVALSFLTYSATMLDHVRCGRVKQMRQMRVDLHRDTLAA